MKCIVSIVVENGKNKIKNEKTSFFQKNKKTRKNGKENNLTLLHLFCILKLKTLFTQFNFNQQIT